MQAPWHGFCSIEWALPAMRYLVKPEKVINGIFQVRLLKSIT